MDVHEATATVREALIFSALLRQPRDVSREDKVAYVDHIIDLLELSDIRDAIIGSESCYVPTGVYMWLSF
jgi:ATP-binding cassette, subfamily G (WHITE), member 2, SNQ2